MKYETTIKLTAEEIRHADNLINVKVLRPIFKDGSVIDSWTAWFDNGYQADIKLVAGGNCCYIDTVLFDDHGYELDAGDPKESILNEFEFNSGDDEYVVKVEQS